jgi:hypothetical protein
MFKIKFKKNPTRITEAFMHSSMPGGVHVSIVFIKVGFNQFDTLASFFLLPANQKVEEYEAD